jgi:hypothetical protein
MPDYAKGKIYKILNSIDDEVYIGSTVEPLCKRMWQHKSEAKTKAKSKLHQHMSNTGIEHFYIELVEQYQCNSKEELCSKEGEWIRKVGTLNRLVAGRTDEQYRQENKSKISESAKQRRADNLIETREKDKEYRDANIDKVREWSKNNYIRHQEQILQGIKTRCTCECGTDVNIHHIARHRGTTKHKQLMEQLNSTMD